MKMKKVSLYIYGLIVAALILSGCAVKQKQDISPQTPVGFYQNNDYVLHRNQKDQSFAHLARVYLGNEKWAWKIEDANPLFTPDKGAMITIPLKDRHIGGLFENGYQKVPILCYHKFGPNTKSPISVTARLFDRQMRYLKENGYRVIHPDDLLDFLSYRRQIPKKSVLITIDDGYKSGFTIARPILKKYGFTAVYFIYTDYAGISSKAISWDELRTLKTDGFPIGSHSVEHSDLSQKKDTESDTEFINRIKRELELSKKIIDKKLNQDTIYFAFPFGRYNNTVIKMARKAGYRLAVTVDRGTNPFFTNPLALKRDMILKKDMNSFISRLKTFSTIPLE